MIDEQLIPFSKAPAHIPGRPSIASLHRWRLRGPRGRQKLETILVGGRRFTSIEAIRRFLEQGADDFETTSEGSELTSDQSDCAAMVEHGLDALGIKVETHNEPPAN